MKLYFLTYKNSLKPTLYNSCELMPLYNFFKYTETNDTKYFTKEHVEVENIALTIEQFYNDYIEYSKNQSIQNRFSTMFEIMRLENKYKSVYSICQAIYNFNPKLDKAYLDSLIELLNALNYKIDSKKELFSQLETILKRIKGIKTRIELLTDKIKTEGVKEVQSINIQLLNIERGLDLKYRLDPKEISVKDFIDYQTQAQKESNERNKKRN